MIDACPVKCEQEEEVPSAMAINKCELKRSLSPIPVQTNIYVFRDRWVCRASALVAMDTPASVARATAPDDLNSISSRRRAPTFSAVATATAIQVNIP